MYRESNIFRIRQGLMLLLELPIGIMYFTIAVTGLSLAVGLIPIILGIPLFIGLMGLSGAVLKFERSRSYYALGEAPPNQHQLETPHFHNWFARFIAALTNKENWKGFLLMIVKLPLGIISFTFVITLFSICVGCIAYPIVRYILIQTIEIDIFQNGLFDLLSINLNSSGESFIYVVIGFVLSYFFLRVLDYFATYYFRLITVFTNL